MDLFEAAGLICDGIATALSQKKGFLLGRNGTIEMQILLQKHFTNSFFQQELLVLERNAGVFPATAASVQKWVKETEESIRNTDLLVAGWYAPIAHQEFQYLQTLYKKGPYLPLRALEPYYVPVDQMWTRFLRFHKVAIVSSFANTAVEQVTCSKEIWGDRADNLLPFATYIPIRTGYAPVLAKGRAEWPGKPSSWEDAVEDVVKEVLKSEADIVLIGCGGLGMIIGHKLKQAGKVCIVMGGAIQVLFGIKGNRWENHSIISRFWNDSWVYPKQEETPGGAYLIENSCYWK